MAARSSSRVTRLIRRSPSRWIATRSKSSRRRIRRPSGKRHIISVGKACSFATTARTKIACARSSAAHATSLRRSRKRVRASASEALHSDVFAIDWSGAKGKRHKGIAIAEAHGEAAPRLIRPGHVWSRDRSAQVAHQGGGAEPTLFGFDFSFAPPLIERGEYLPGEPVFQRPRANFGPMSTGNATMRTWARRAFSRKRTGAIFISASPTG